MNKFSPKQNFLIFILVTLAFWTVFGLLTYYFLASDIKRLSREVFSKKADLLQLDYNARNIDYFREDYQKLEQDGLRLEDAVLSESETIVFIEKLERIAADHNVTQTIELSETETKKDKKSEKKGETEEIDLAGLKSFSYRLEIAGTFFDLVRYIQALENLDNYTNLNFIHLTIQEESGVLGVIEAEIYVE